MTVEAKQVEKSIKLSDARAQLLLTQRKLASLAGVSPMVVSNAENGYPIRRLSAYAILTALNEQRQAKGWVTLDFDEMDWKIQGNGDEK